VCRRIRLIHLATGVITAIKLFGCAGWIFLVTTLSPADVTHDEEAGAALGAALWLAAAMPLALAAWDLASLRRLTRAGEPVVSDDWVLAWQALDRTAIRFLGKTLLTIAVELLWLSRRVVVLDWLRGHPLTLFMLFFGALVIFTLLDVTELFFRVSFGWLSTPVETGPKADADADKLE
jgi:hypothetical protein